MFYKCKHFQISELVDKATYNKLGEQAWMLFNPTALIALDGIREYFGSAVYVNDWSSSGVFQFRGFRSMTCNTGATYSQHRFGNAFDCDVKGLSANSARKQIVDDMDSPLLEFITCLESDVNWVHFDCRNIEERILMVKPY